MRDRFLRILREIFGTNGEAVVVLLPLRAQRKMNDVFP